ncbi:Wall-associated receptor kinase [Theobroma cacao]|nr:Wall-associated receptor kinase [Theobroma cacao]
MNIHFFFSPLPSSISIIFIFILIVLPIAYFNGNGQFLECNETFNCGIIQGLEYPLWGSVWPRYCGHGEFELIHEENQFPIININAQRFYALNLLDFSPSRFHFSLGHSPSGHRHQHIAHSFFLELRSHLLPPLICWRVEALRLSIDSSLPSLATYILTCTAFNGNNYAYYLDESLLRIHRSELTECNISIRVPVNGNEFDELWSGNDTIEGAWKKGFDVTYHKDIMECVACRNSGGVCGYDNATLEFLCFCRDQPYPQFCLASVLASVDHHRAGQSQQQLLSLPLFPRKF